MPSVSIPLIGPTYTNRSLPVSAQVTSNFYIEVNEAGGEIVSFLPFPGLKLLTATGIGKGRGLGVYKNEVYAVAGSELYKIKSNNNASLLGTISGSNRCKLVDDGINLVITNGTGNPYTWDGATLIQGSDPDLFSSNTSAFINRRIVYDGESGDVIFADLDSPLTVNSLNILIEETASDDTIAVEVHRKQIFVFGTETVAPYYPIETGNPPYTVITNAVQDIGLEAIHSVGKNKDFVYFLGNDLQIYRIAGLDIQPVGNPAICQAIRNYGTAKDAFGDCFTFDGLRFYFLSFPTGNESWLLNEQSGLWTNLASGTVGGQHYMSGYVKAYDKHIVGDRRNGNIYELDFETFTDNSKIIYRRRDTVSINGRTFGKPGVRVFMSKLELVIEPGASLVTVDADIMMQYSDDNGRTWSSERWSSIGDQGDYTYKLQWYSLGWFYNRMFRFTMSDPIKWVLISANADVELGIV